MIPFPFDDLLMVGNDGPPGAMPRRTAEGFLGETTAALPVIVGSLVEWLCTTSSAEQVSDSSIREERIKISSCD
jgi:hypothetical protein